MINLESTYKKKSHISLTPLIDVVFILLIFFMLATSFTKWNAIILTSGQSGAQLESELKGTLVFISKSGLLKVDENTYILEELKSLIRNKIKIDPDHYLVIMPEIDTPLQKVIDLMADMNPIVGNNISLAQNI